MPIIDAVKKRPKPESELSPVEDHASREKKIQTDREAAQREADALAQEQFRATWAANIQSQNAAASAAAAAKAAKATPPSAREEELAAIIKRVDALDKFGTVSVLAAFRGDCRRELRALELLRERENEVRERAEREAAQPARRVLSVRLEAPNDAMLVSAQFLNLLRVADTNEVCVLSFPISFASDANVLRAIEQENERRASQGQPPVATVLIGEDRWDVDRVAAAAGTELVSTLISRLECSRTLLRMAHQCERADGGVVLALGDGDLSFASPTARLCRDVAIRRGIGDAVQFWREHAAKGAQ
jgi:hypothetical protein